MTYYDEISEGYEELHREEQLKKMEIVKQNIEIKPDWLLLDVGCGTGLTSDFPCRVIGLDPSIKLLMKNPTEIKVVAEAEHIPFKDRTFDIVSSITAIQNFRDIEKGLKEIRRVGKGRFILSFLKKSGRREEIEKTIKSFFRVETVLEEDKDVIYICQAKNI